MDTQTLQSSLQQGILEASKRVYEVGEATPLDHITILDPSIEIFVKREDISPIHAYKWRGAYNRMVQLTTDELSRGVVTSSAGNHAQGVARAAAARGLQATILMPEDAPRVKIVGTRAFGGTVVT